MHMHMHELMHMHIMQCTLFCNDFHQVVGAFPVWRRVPPVGGVVPVAAQGMAAMREVESKLVDVLTAAVVQSPPLLKDAVLLVRDLGRKLFPLWFSNVFQAICCYGPARLWPRSCHSCKDPLKWGRCGCEGAGAGQEFDITAD